MIAEQAPPTVAAPLDPRLSVLLHAFRRALLMMVGAIDVCLAIEKGRNGSTIG